MQNTFKKIAIFAILALAIAVNAASAQPASGRHGTPQSIADKSRQKRFNQLHMFLSYNYDDPINRRLISKIDELTGTDDTISIIPGTYLGFGTGSGNAAKLKDESFAATISGNNGRVILAMEDGAVDAIAEKLNEIPNNIPIILAGIDKYPPKFTKKHRNTSAVFHPRTCTATLRFALEIFPLAKRVFILTDLSPRGDFVSEDIKRIKSEFLNVDIVEIEHEKTSTSEMLARIAETTRNDIIVFCSWLTENDRSEYTNSGILEKISDATTAPIFSPYRDSVFKPEVLGGEIMNFENFAENVLAKVSQALRTGGVSSTESIEAATERTINFQLMRRYDLNVSDIPKGTLFRKVPPSFFSLYKDVFLWGIGIFGTLTFIIATLVMANLKIRKQRNLLNSILSLTPMNVYITDIEGKVLIAYERGVDLSSEKKSPLEKSKGDKDILNALGKNIVEILSPYRGAANTVREFLHSDEKTRSGEWAMTLPNGFKRWRSATFLRLDNSAGTKNMKFAFFSYDTTQTRQLRDFIASELSLRNRILESTVNAVLVVNSEGKISFMNNRAAEFKGATPKAFIGKFCGEFFNGITSITGEDVSRDFKRAVKNRESLSLKDIRFPTAKDEIKTVDAYLAPIKMSDGKSDGSLITMRDITEISLARDRLEYVRQFMSNAVEMMKAYYFSFDIRKHKFVPACTSESLLEIGDGHDMNRFYEHGLSDEDKDAVKENFENLVEGKIERFDRNFKRFDNGEEQYFIMHAYRSKSANNDNVIIGVILNYTETRKSQDALSEVRMLLDSIFMYAPYGISLKDLDDGGKFILWNKALENMIGIDSAYAVGKTRAEIGLAVADDDDKTTLERGSFSSEVMKVKNRRDNSVNYYSYRKIAIKARGHSMIMTIFENSTDYVKSEYEKNEIIENVPEAVALLDSTKRVLYANKYAEKLTNLSHDEIVGAYCNGLLCQNAHGHFCTSANAITSKRRQAAIKTINGRVYNVISSPILDDDGAVEKIVMTFTDITEDEENKNKLSAALKKANAAAIAKSAFLSTMSHEIRTPLNVIIGSSELLNLENLPPAAADSNQAIYVASVALSQIINNILDYSKLDAGKMEIIRRTTRIEGIVADMSRLFKMNAESHGLEFATEIADGIPPLMLDNQHIKQILMNIIGNAIKFTKKGYVKVGAKFERTDEKHGVLSFIISDTGCGISEQKKATIFLPFEREISNNRIQGTGLGLSISMLLVKLMRGKIDVDTKIGEGTTFTVSIPELEIVEELPNGGSAPDIETGVVKFKKSKILAVDDIAMNRMVLRKILTKLNIQSEEADCVDNALTKLRAEKFDAVITDLWMPKKSGADLVEEMAKDAELSKIPAFLLTADTEMKVNFKVDRFRGIIMKPVNIKNISRALMNVLPTE